MVNYGKCSDCGKDLTLEDIEKYSETCIDCGIKHDRFVQKVANALKGQGFQVKTNIVIGKSVSKLPN